MGTRERPSLWHPSLFALTWQFCVWFGWGLVLLAVLVLRSSDITVIGWPLVVVAGLAFLGELRPVIASNVYVGAGVAISTAFVFAALYLWGFAPAIVLQAAAILVGEIMNRKDVWRILFNVGQYNLSVAAGYSQEQLTDIAGYISWAAGAGR